MDTAQWPQEIFVKPLDEIVTNTCPKPSSNNKNTIERKLTRPQKEQALNCPRCNSTNTKFCYYNNYSLTQPRYFCKSCRRYWTSGGSLRNIPVGGGSRKNKRSSSSSSSSLSPSPSSTTTTSSSSKIMTKLPDLVHPSSTTQTQKTMMTSQGQDLNLGFPSANNNTDYGNTNTNITASTTTTISALELLTGLTSRGFNSFMPMPVYHPNSVYGNTNTTITTSTTTTTSTASGFSLIPDQEFKPSLNFSLDGLGSGYGSLQESNSVTNGRLLFPFEDLKQVSARSNEIEPNNKDQADSATGYWTGMLGGGSW